MKKRPRWATYIVLGRKMRGWGADELAKKVGKCRPTITGWESGRWTPTIDDFEKTINVLGLSFLGYHKFNVDDIKEHGD